MQRPDTRKDEGKPVLMSHQLLGVYHIRSIWIYVHMATQALR